MTNEKLEELSEVSFQIITSVGMARSNYIEAIQEASQGHFDQARTLVDEGAKEYLKGHHAHLDMVQKEASGESTEMTLLLTHAEDQLMSAEAFGILTDMFIDLYQRLDADEALLKTLSEQ